LVAREFIRWASGKIIDLVHKLVWVVAPKSRPAKTSFLPARDHPGAISRARIPKSSLHPYEKIPIASNFYDLEHSDTSKLRTFRKFELFLCTTE
jgi:hypothetical protein